LCRLTSAAASASTTSPTNPPRELVDITAQTNRNKLNVAPYLISFSVATSRI
jgi:hypothetical protein